eukprot:1184587-Prorocentrum_minimum.AAC.2
MLRGRTLINYAIEAQRNRLEASKRLTSTKQSLPSRSRSMARRCSRQCLRSFSVAPGSSTLTSLATCAGSKAPLLARSRDRNAASAPAVSARTRSARRFAASMRAAPPP